MNTRLEDVVDALIELGNDNEWSIADVETAVNAAVYNGIERLCVAATMVSIGIERARVGGGANLHK